MAWSAKGIPDLSGRTALVTGANGGLGLQTAHALAARGAHVIIAARSQTKASAAEAAIRASVDGARLEVQPLDLGSLQSVRRLAAAVFAGHDHLDLLINNAGVMGAPRMETADGFELQIGTNHLGHFALTALLMPRLLAAPAARVVAVTSFARLYGGRMAADDPHLREGYEPWRAYGRSKMANLDFAVALDAKLRHVGASAMALAAQPGLSRTDLQATSVELTGGGPSQRFFHGAAKLFGMDPDRGALSQLRAATAPEADGGQLYAPRWGTCGPPVVKSVAERDPAELAAMWQVSERETGIDFSVALP